MRLKKSVGSLYKNRKDTNNKTHKNYKWCKMSGMKKVYLIIVYDSYSFSYFHPYNLFVLIYFSRLLFAQYLNQILNLNISTYA